MLFKWSCIYNENNHIMILIYTIYIRIIPIKNIIKNKLLCVIMKTYFVFNFRCFDHFLFLIALNQFFLINYLLPSLFL